MPGEHTVSAEVWLASRAAPVAAGPVHFTVLPAAAADADMSTPSHARSSSPRP